MTLASHPYADAAYRVRAWRTDGDGRRYYSNDWAYTSIRSSDWPPPGG